MLVDSIGDSHITYEVFLISPIIQSIISILPLSDYNLFSSIGFCQSCSLYARCIHLRVTGVSRSVANLRCWAVTYSLYTYVFPWQSTTLGADCLCFNTPSDVLVELPCFVNYFLLYEAFKTVNWASAYRSCLCLPICL